MVVVVVVVVALAPELEVFQKTSSFQTLTVQEQRLNSGNLS